MLRRCITSLALAVMLVLTTGILEVHAFGLQKRFGSPTQNPGSGDGEFNTPFGIATDNLGFTYISDMERIKSFLG